MIAHIAFSLLLGLVGGRSSVMGREYLECSHIAESNILVASQSSCSKYIFCDGEKSFEGECLEGNFFNAKEGKCDDRAAVDCPIGVIESVTSVNPIYTDAITTQTVGNNFKFNAHSTPSTPRPPHAATSMSGTGYVSHIAQCPLAPHQNKTVYLPNPNSCSAYYICFRGNAIPMICPRDRYFDATQGRCEPRRPQYCDLKRHTVRLDCAKGIYDFMPHRRNCQYYHYCSDGFLMILQCPFSFAWHYERRTCVHKSQAKCFSESLLPQKASKYDFRVLR